MFYSYAVRACQNIVFTSRLEQTCYNLTNAWLIITYHHFNINLKELQSDRIDNAVQVFVALKEVKLIY